jgi:SAM-dependent methyltransferase
MPQTALEVGCREGFALHYVSPLRYTGVDTSFARVQLASIHNKNHTFVQGDGTVLPFRSGHFDLVFCMGTLHHLSKQGIFLMIQEMGRVCKTKGWVAIIEPNAYNPSSFLMGLLRKPERGILHCKAKVFLGYFRRLGMSGEMKINYIGTFSPLCLLSYFFKGSDFVKTPWFMRLWKRADDFVNKIIPERFWTSMVITARKGGEGGVQITGDRDGQTV